MARKKVKNFKVEQQELTPLTIGVFESRRKSSLGIFIIMTIFVLVVIFLPEISDKIDAYLHPETIVSGGHTQEPIEPPEEEEPTPAETFYELASNPTIKTEDLTMDSFKLEDNILSFHILNTSNTSYNITDLNYYLELYDANQTLLSRLKIMYEGDTLAGGSVNIIKTLSSNISSQLVSILLVKKDIQEYPSITLTSNDEGISTLVCTKDYEKVTYKFKDNKLQELTSEITYPSTALNYEETLNNYRNLSTSYNNKAGIVSLFSGTTDGTSFNITTNVNLSEISKRSYIFNADTYTLNTEPKVVNFEMEAQDFICN